MTLTYLPLLSCQMATTLSPVGSQSRQQLLCSFGGLISTASTEAMKSTLKGEEVASREGVSPEGCMV